MIRSLSRSLYRSAIHFAFASISLAVACVHLPCQADTATSAKTEHNPEVLDKQEIFRRIGVFEDAARKADSVHLDHQTMIEIYRNLGMLYEMAGMYPLAEAAMQRATELMKDGPPADLAEEFNDLSTIHGILGNHRQAEKDQMHALAIRQKIGDPVGIALTWTDIAGIYYQGRQYKKALEYAQRSYDVLANRKDLKPTNHLAVLEIMAFALCRARQCQNAVPIMKQAVEESKSAFGAEGVSAAAEGFALGYVYWQSGDMVDAGEWMERSLARMKVDLGWGAPIYVRSMEQYAQFLRQTGQREAASNTESEVRQIESVVDARTLTTRGGDFLSHGSH